jgi:hypothetical protein
MALSLVIPPLHSHMQLMKPKKKTVINQGLAAFIQLTQLPYLKK